MNVEREGNLLERVKANFVLLLKEELQNRGKHADDEMTASKEYSQEQRKYLEGLGIKIGSDEWIELVKVVTELLKEKFPDELKGKAGEYEWEEKGRQLFQ